MRHNVSRFNVSSHNVSRFNFLSDIRDTRNQPASLSSLEFPKSKVLTHRLHKAVHIRLTQDFWDGSRERRAHHLCWIAICVRPTHKNVNWQNNEDAWLDAMTDLRTLRASDTFEQQYLCHFENGRST
jgi:hypothetical protein